MNTGCCVLGDTSSDTSHRAFPVSGVAPGAGQGGPTEAPGMALEASGRGPATWREAGPQGAGGGRGRARGPGSTFRSRPDRIISKGGWCE